MLAASKLFLCKPSFTHARALTGFRSAVNLKMAQSRCMFPVSTILAGQIADKVSEIFPISVSQEDFEENPEFAKLMSDLCSRLKSGGMSDDLSRQIQQAEDDLKQAKSAYLREKIIHDALQESLFEFETRNCKITPLSSNSKVYTSLRERLTGAEICDYLNYSENSSQDEKEYPLLGLSKDFVLNHLPSLDSKVLNDKIIPEIEDIISERCKTILHFRGQETSDKLVSAKMFQLPACLEAEKEDLKNKEQKLQFQKRTTEKLMWNYFEALLEAIDLLKTFLLDYYLKSRKEYNSTSSKFLTVKCDALLHKIRVVELQLLCDTYTVETVAALKKIKGLLDEDEEKTEKELTRVSNLLEVYQSVSTTFDSLVQDYTRLRAEIDNQKWALRELKKTL